MSSFSSPETGDFDKYFMTTSDLIDRYVVGNLWGWGDNSHGQLGDNSIINKSSPVQTIAGGINWKFVFGGVFHTVAIKTDGTLWVWGRNNYGQLGDDSTISKSSPVQTISGGNNWKSVSGGDSTLAIKTDGTLWGWGTNLYGQLGDGSNITRSSPVQIVSMGFDWKSVSTGTFHTSAVKTDGTLWTWGYNYYGQLGDNSNIRRSSPVQTICGGNDWKQVSVGNNFTTAIKTDGTLWSCGYNYHGQLGNNSTTNTSSPVQTVATGTNWKSVDCYLNHTLAIKTDGTLWGWGFNVMGDLGDNSTISKSSPVQTICGGNNWKQCSSGYYGSSAIKTDGSLWIWGSATSGKLGNNSSSNKSSPIQTVVGGSNWKFIDCGNCFHVMALQFSNGIGVE